MPWSTPTLRDVRSMVRDGIRTNLPGSDANVPNSVLRVMCDAMGALGHLTLQYIDWLSLQLLPDTAETEWLDRHGQIWLVNADGSVGRKVATLASGTVSTTGTVGVIIPAFSQLMTSDGIGFETTDSTTLGGIATPTPVRALDPGAAGNLSVGAGMSFVTPPTGVDLTAFVIALTGGTDDETDDELRARVLQRIQEPPMGGSQSDWIRWTLEVPGVTDAWAFPLEQGMGTVTTRFLMRDLRADNNGGFPLAEDVTTVANYLDTKRPVAVKDTFVVAPIPFPLQMSINSLVTDSVSTRQNIEQSIRDMLVEKAIPGSTVYNSWVESAISDAVGVNHFELTFATTVMPTPGHLAILGSVIYAGG